MPGSPPSAPPAKWPAWKVGGVTMLVFIALLYAVEIADMPWTATGSVPGRNAGCAAFCSHRCCTPTGAI